MQHPGSNNRGAGKVSRRGARLTTAGVSLNQGVLSQMPRESIRGYMELGDQQ